VEQTVRAIVLRREDKGESDRRLTLLTSELGKIGVIARGAKKSTSRLAAASEPLSIGRYTFTLSKKNRYLSQAQPERGLARLRTDYDRLLAGIAIAELAAAVLPWEHPAELELAVLEQGLSALHEAPSIPAAYAWAILRFLSTTGQQPDFSAVPVIGEGSERRAWLSPSHGGAWNPDEGVPRDRFSAPYSAVVALAKLTELETAPRHLREPLTILEALYPFLVNVADLDLPATRQYLGAARTPAG